MENDFHQWVLTSWERCQTIAITCYRPPRLYKLPQVHVAGVLLRTIISTTGAVTHKLAKYLASLEGSLLGTFPHHVRNSDLIPTHTCTQTEHSPDPTEQPTQLWWCFSFCKGDDWGFLESSESAVWWRKCQTVPPPLHFLILLFQQPVPQTDRWNCHRLTAVICHSQLLHRKLQGGGNQHSGL